MRKFLIAVVAATLASAAHGAPPKLIVAISVDQFSADLFDEYRPHYTGGFARLASGAVFHNGYQGHAATETCPGHSTILTGDRPARTGIIANNWVDQSIERDDKGVYCAEDERVAGSSTTSYTVSPLHLLVPTFGERLKDAHPGSRSVAVSGKDRAAVMMSGHKVDQRWYWTGDKFVTDQKGAAVPAKVADLNAAVANALSAPRPALEAPPLCEARSKAVAIEGSEKSVGTGHFARNANDQAAFRASPELDRDTLALAALLTDDLQLGKRTDTDVLAISLSATDYVGHTYGTQGAEMCLQLLALDRELGNFLGALDARGIDYAVTLTADHGGLDVPERMRIDGGDKGAARVDPRLSSGTMGLKLVNQLGLSGFGLLGDGPFGDIYVDHSLPAAQQKRLHAAAVAAYRKHPQVEAVFAGAQLAATPLATTPPDQWTLIQRARASYYPGRSGDLIVLLKRDITPISETSRYVATHGSAWDYDRRVPILFWRRGMAASNSETSVETVDIMPTLAAWVGLPLAPGAVDGKCLDGVVGVSCPAR